MSNDTTTTLALATRLDLPHRSVLKCIARANLDTLPRALWSQHFRASSYVTADGKRRRCWYISGNTGLMLLSRYLPRTPSVCAWKVEIAALAMARDDAAKETTP